VSEHLLELPALFLRNRLSLDDADLIAYCGVAILIVGIELLRSLDDLLEARVWHTVSVFNNDGFIH